MIKHPLPPVPAPAAPGEKQQASCEYRDALEAIREALDIPYAATVGDEMIRAKIMEQRVIHAVGTLERILSDDPYLDILWQVAYLQARLAEHPAEGYMTWDQRMPELDTLKAQDGGR